MVIFIQLSAVNNLWYKLEIPNTLILTFETISILDYSFRIILELA